QADASTARKYGGTGLGLSICKSLVELMEGTIGVASESGKGSVFSFELPFQVREAVAPIMSDTKELAPVEAVAPNFAGMRVLVAEDNEHNQLLIELLLKKQGVETTLVNNGAEAIENLRQNSYDLVFMDLEMPVMGGFEAVAAIREVEKKTGQRVLIVALSAHAPEEQRALCIAAGMDDYLMKPFDVKSLQETLRRHAPARLTPAA
ncbi:MAG: response regulator, partial [Limisphaerales bacterium]